MNRCIQCYRCVRFYQEFAGGTDFGVMGSAERIYYGRVEDGQLQSPFSGNLVDICPPVFSPTRPPVSAPATGITTWPRPSAPTVRLAAIPFLPPATVNC